MKKKTLLLTLLALAILTSITAGTLAVYTKSVTMHSDVEIKKFAFDAVGKLEFGGSIKLAPKEKQTYIFDVTNFVEKGPAAEVPLDYTILVNFENATSLMPGLVARLYEDGKEVESTNNGSLTWNNSIIEGKPITHNYKLVVEWLGDNDKLHTTAGENVPGTDGLQIVVTATQKV